MSPQIMPSDAELRPNRADDVQSLEEDARLQSFGQVHLAQECLVARIAF